MPKTATPGAKFSIELVMLNEGFARVMNPRDVEIILRNRATSAIYRLRVDQPRGSRLWLPGPSETVSRKIEMRLPADMPAGKYELLLNLPDPYPSLHGRPEYTIRLANQGVWEEKTGFNRLLHSIGVD